jgi:hypothetical protein
MTDYLKQELKKKCGKKVETRVSMLSVFMNRPKTRSKPKRDTAQVSGETIGIPMNKKKNKVIPVNPVARGVLHIFVSLVMAYMSFFSGTVMAIALIFFAIINSAYGQMIIYRAGNKLSE